MRGIVFAGLLALAQPLGAASSTAGGIEWLRDDRAAFERARAEDRYVLLYLEAVWCHWCHVMDHETYGNAAVRALVDAHYVPLRIDQDLRPDLANRYRDYGWPATIVLAPDATEIVKRRGYVAPERFARLLQAIVDDPSPEHAAAVDLGPAAPHSSLAPEVRTELLARHRKTFDPVHGGLATNQKFLDRDQVEWAIDRAIAGDADERRIAKASLDGALALVDPAWGGVYQYSTHGDWLHPHYEKLGWLQGDYLRVYARGYAALGERRHLDAARAIRRYVEGFLRAPEGGWYTSQDADLAAGEHSGDYFALDDAARRPLGMPRIDRHRYAREAGTIAEAYAVLHEAADDREALADAIAGVRWALAERALPGGGFRHDSNDTAGPYLADTLAMGRAFLALHRATGEREWLEHAGAAARFIEAKFRAASGYASAARGDTPIAPLPHVDENIALARYANLLARYTGDAAHAAIAKHAFAWLARRDVALARLTEAGVLLVDAELARDPLHLAVVGAKDDEASAALHAACLRVPGAYKRLEWWDRAEGALPNPDIAYPKLAKPAAFVCTENTCSTPIREPAEIARFLAEVAR